MKIRNKLTYKFAVLVASLLLVFSVAVYFFSANYREQEFDKRLINKGLATAHLLIKVDEVDGRLLRIIDKNNLTTLTNEKITIYDSLYNKIYSSDDDPEIPVSNDLFREIKDNSNVFFNHQENEVVGVLYEEANNRFFIIVSAYDQFGLNKLRNLRLVLITLFFISVLGIFIAGYIFSGQALKPISDIIESVKFISINNLHHRLNEGNGQDEIAQLAIQFNNMLDRIERAFQMQKSFVSNASHELRTPLSIVRAQLDVVLGEDRDKEEYKNCIESVQEDINKLIDLSNGLLDLAHVGFQISNFPPKKVRIDEVVYLAVSEVQKKFPDSKISLTIKDEEEEKMFLASGNENLLKTALLNIFDNACKFSNNSPVKAIISSTEEEIVIEVEDKGCGIKTGEIEHIFDPFYRGSNVRSIAGHGIGLSLSSRIVNMHKGKIKINSKINEGTKVTIFFPLVA
jgi:signal transduction histidine kinase